MIEEKTPNSHGKPMVIVVKQSCLTDSCKLLPGKCRRRRGERLCMMIILSHQKSWTLTEIPFLKVAPHGLPPSLDARSDQLSRRMLEDQVTARPVMTIKAI